MKAIGCVFLILVLLSACSGADLADPDNFKHFEGTLIQLYEKILVVESDDGQKMTFIAKRETAFIPRESRRMRDFLNIGCRLRIRYFIKPYSHRNIIGDYFYASEVRRLKH